MLLVMLESLLQDRLPIPNSIRESRSTSTRVEAMKIFLGVLSNDLLVKSGFGETVINEVAEIDPKKLALGEHDECFVIGEVLCRFAKSHGLLQERHVSSRVGTPAGRASSPDVFGGLLSPVPRAPSFFSVSNISPPLSKEQGPSSPSPSRHNSPSPLTSSKSLDRSHTPSTILTPVRRSEKKRVLPSNDKQHPSPSPPSGLRTRQERPESSHMSYDDHPTNKTVIMDDIPAREYHATTTFFAESSMASIPSRGSSPSHSFCTCDRTLTSEADTTYCTCGLSIVDVITSLSPRGIETNEHYLQAHIRQPTEEATLLDEENPFFQFSRSKMPLDLIVPRTGQTYIEDKSIYAHPTLVRTSGRIERVNPDHDFEEFLRSHPQVLSQSNYHGVVRGARSLGPTKHTSPFEYRSALLRERARLYAEIARARQL
jgi:hypothetical protein